MSEKYIKAELFKAAVIEVYESLRLDVRSMERAHLLIEVIDKFPAADVEPVVRGEWKPDNRIFGAWHCSVCGESALCNGIEEEVKSAFCPYCGAKMNVN